MASYSEESSEEIHSPEEGSRTDSSDFPRYGSLKSDVFPYERSTWEEHSYYEYKSRSLDRGDDYRYRPEDCATDFSSDPLQDASASLQEYIKRLKDRFPATIHIYSFLYNILRWKHERPNLNMAILSPEGDPARGVLAYYLKEDAFIGTVYAETERCAEVLGRALEATKRLHLTKPFTCFTGMSELSLRAARRLLPGPGWSVCRESVLWLPWYVAREMDINLPEDVEIRELSGENALQVSDAWNYQFPGSEDLLKEIIEVNCGLGVFHGDRLLAWAIYGHYGGISVHQTEEGEKMKGYGRAVMEAITKRLGEHQIDVHFSIDPGDTGASAFYHALGFRNAFTSHWIYKREDPVPDSTLDTSEILGE